MKRTKILLFSFALIATFLFIFFSPSFKSLRQKAYLISNTFSKNPAGPIPLERGHFFDSVGNNADSKVMTFEINLSSQPKQFTITPAKLKFNKKAWASIEWDDNSLSAMKALPILKNGYFTDGCGNKLPYTAALAVIGAEQRADLEVGEMSDNADYNDLITLILNNWDIENHGYYHEPTGNYNFGNDRYRNIHVLDSLIFERINYKMNGLVVPTNYDGFPTAAKNFGYIFSTSLQTFDGLAPAAFSDPRQMVYEFDRAPTDYSAFRRLFSDDWEKYYHSITNAINKLLTLENGYFRMASHTIDEAVFAKLIQNMQDRFKDQVLVVSTREIMEYRIVSNQKIKYRVDGSKIIVEINTSPLSDRIRWKDLSLLLHSDAQIVTVKPKTGIDSVSYNPGSGMINIFKQN